MTNTSANAITERLRGKVRSIRDFVATSVLAQAFILGLVGIFVFVGIKYALDEAEREKLEKQQQAVKKYELEQERRNQELENTSKQVAPFDIGEEEFGSLGLSAFKRWTGLEPIITDQENNSVSANFGNGLFILTLYGSTRTINDDSFSIK